MKNKLLILSVVLSSSAFAETIVLGENSVIEDTSHWVATPDQVKERLMGSNPTGDLKAYDIGEHNIVDFEENLKEVDAYNKNYKMTKRTANQNVGYKACTKEMTKYVTEADRMIKAVHGNPDNLKNEFKESSFWRGLADSEKSLFAALVGKSVINPEKALSYKKITLDTIDRKCDSYAKKRF